MERQAKRLFPATFHHEEIVDTGAVKEISKLDIGVMEPTGQRMLTEQMAGRVTMAVEDMAGAGVATVVDDGVTAEPEGTAVVDDHEAIAARTVTEDEGLGCDVEKSAAARAAHHRHHQAAAPPAMQPEGIIIRSRQAVLPLVEVLTLFQPHLQGLLQHWMYSRKMLARLCQHSHQHVVFG